MHNSLVFVRMPNMRNKKRPCPGQLEFHFPRQIEKDRNFDLGGRSFYFFDFDDNVATLATPVGLFDKNTGRELTISSREFAQNALAIGKEGTYSNYFIDFCDSKGSFRYCRDQEIPLFKKFKGTKQQFILDIEAALLGPAYSWKAPSWNCFYHATFNQRPISLITARGHHRETIKKGIDLFVKDGHLPSRPNYLSIYPVSNRHTRADLGDHDLKLDVPELKRRAIHHSVEMAMEQYGTSEHHRFGMSDDDPKNVELITEAMHELKIKYPQMSFFVIQTYEDSFEKREVLATKTREIISKQQSKSDQLSLFL